MGREPGLPPPSATAHGIQFCAPTHRVTVIPDFAQIGGYFAPCANRLCD